MMRAALSVLLAAMFLSVLVPNATADGAAFYEIPLVMDEPDDFAQGALDLTNVYASELYPYDADADEGRDEVVIRLEPRGILDANQCLVRAPQVSLMACSIVYNIHFRAAGSDHAFFVNFKPPGDGKCCEIIAANGRAAFNGTSAFFLLDRTELGLTPGTTIERLYATSQLANGDAREAGDRLPGDNQGLPYDQRPDLADVFAPPYTLRGTYAFFEVVPVTDTVLPSVNGESVKFRFQIRPNPGVAEDTVRVLFDKPDGWSITPSRGTTGVRPVGLLTGLQAGGVYDFDFSANANDIVNVGDMVPIGVRFHSASQGYQYVPVVVRITQAGYDDPNYVFKLLDSGTFQAGSTTTLRFQVLDAAGLPHTGLDVLAVFNTQGRRIAEVPATESGGDYSVAYAFPSGGTWTVELRLADLRPAPHGVFTINVEDASGAPSLGFLVIVLAAMGVAASRRR